MIARRLLVLSSAAALAIAAAAFAIVALRPGTSPVPRSAPLAFVHDQLGPTAAPATIARPRPSTSSVTRIDRHGFVVTSKTSPDWRVTLSAVGNGNAAWRAHAHGVSRPTPFGRETIVADGTGVEQLSTVVHHLGSHTWTWNLDSSLRARLLPNGGVGFAPWAPGRVSDLVIAPLQVFDAYGRDITPAGAHWQLGGTPLHQTLVLHLDDAKLPLPYVVDPAFRAATQAAVTTAASTSMNVTATGLPAGNTAGDLLVASIAVSSAGASTAAAGPAGWTAIGATSNVNTRLFTFYKIETAGETNPTFTLSNVTSGSTKADMTLTDYTGIEAGNPLDAYFQATGSSTTPNVGSINTTGNNRLIVFAVANPVNNGSILVQGNIANQGTFLTNSNITAGPPSLGVSSLAVNSRLSAATTAGFTLTTTGAWAAQAIAFVANDASPFERNFASSNNAGTATASTVIGPPTGLDNGDVMIAAIGVANATVTMAAPTGWTAIGVTHATGGETLFSFYKVANNESGNYTFTPSPSSTYKQNGSITAYSGMENTAPLDTSGTAPGYFDNNSGGSTSSAVSVTGIDTAGANRWSVFMEANSNTTARTMSSPTLNGAAMTTRANLAVSPSVSVADLEEPTQLATVSAAGTLSFKSIWTAQVISLVEDTTAPTSQTLSVTEGTNPNWQYFNSATNTQYYNTAKAGDFTISSVPTDTGYIDWVSFPDVINVTGFTGQGLADGSSTYTSNTYSWTTGNTTAPSGLNVSAWDAGGNHLDTPFTLTRDITAPTSTVQCNGAACSASWYTASPVSIAFSGSDTGAGVKRIVYTTDGSTPAVDATDTVTNGTVINASSGSFNLSTEGTNTIKWIVEDNVANVSTVSTQTVKIDTVKPAFSTFTVNESVNCPSNVYTSGTTIYYNSNGAACANAFTVTQTITDATSLPNTVNFPAIASGSFAHSNETIVSPWTSAQYGWTAAGASYSGSQTMTATDNATNSQTSSFSIQNDNAAPTGGALTINGGATYLSSGTTVTISRTDYTEATDATHSGLASSTLSYYSQTLSGNTCSGGWSLVGTVSGTTSPTLSTAKCYQFVLVGTDNVGNSTSITSQTIKVDTTDPGAPSLAFSSLTQSYYPGSGSTVYFKSGGTGGFTVTPSSTDGGSGISSYSYPTLTGFGNTAGAYTFTGTSATASGSVTATSNAGRTGAGTTLTAQVDGNLPTAGALTVNGTAATAGGSSSYQTSGTTFTISRTDWAEAQDATHSGLASSTLSYSTAPLTSSNGTAAGTCGSYTPQGTITGTTSPALSDGTCYLFTLTGTDNVGNSTSISTTVMVDKTAASAPTGIAVSSPTNAYFPGSGTKVYFKSAAAGGFTVTASGALDNQTGIAGYTYGAGGGSGFSNTNGAYTFTAAAGTQNATLTANNVAGTSGGGTLAVTFQADANAPTGGAVTVNGGAAYLSSGTSVTVSTTNYAETQSATESGLASNALTVQQGGLSGNTCSGYGGSTDITGQTSYTVSTGHCYLFTLTGTDRVGNAATTTAVVKVDTTDPGAPSLAFSGLTSAYAVGTKVYFKSGGTGGFTVTPTSTDGGSGISSYSYPTLTGFGNTAGAYTFNATSATQSGSVTATSNAGRTGAGTTFTAQADANAPGSGALTINGGATYVTSGTSVAISRTDYTETQSATESGLASSTLTYQTATLSANSCGSFGGGGTVTGTTSPTLSDATCYQFTLTGTDQVGNSASITRTIKVDETPANAPTGISVSALSNAYYPGSGTKIYFKSGATGGFTLTGSGATDAETGIAGYTYPSLTGFGGTGVYTFNASSATQSGNITANNNAGTAGGGTLAITAQADSNGPTGGSITVNGGATYLNSGTSVTVSTTNFAEAQSATESGLASNALTVQQGTLSNNTCSGYGGTTDITGQTSYTVSTAHCYLFTLTGTDNVGNTSTTTTSVKVDTSAPGAPTLAFSGLSNAYYPGSGTKVYFKGGVAGGFTVTPTSTDGGSGIASYSYPSLTGFGNTAGAYTFTGASATQSGSIAATNNAGLTGAGTTFTAQADANPPGSGALTVNGGATYVTSGTTVAISRTDYTETQSATESGLASSTLTYQTATLSGNGCGSFGGGGTVTGTTSPTLSDATCYQFTLTGTDQVGNTASITRTIKVDETPANAPTGFSVSSPTNAYYPGSGTKVYFQGGATGGFTLTGSGATDAQTAIAGYSYSSLTGFGGTSGAYTFDPSSTTQSGTITANNNAGTPGGGTLSFTAQADSSAPTGGSVTVNGGATYLTSGTSVTVSTTNFAETQSATQSGLASNALTVQQGTLSNNTCTSYGSSTDITGQSSYTVSTAHCYLFTLTGTDNVGNTSTTTTSVKVDTTAPSAPSAISVGGTSNAYFPGSGTTVYFKGGATGSFTVTGSGATDGDTAIASYAYSSLTGFGGSAGAYTFDASSTTQTGSVTATNGAGLTGAGLAFTAQADSAAPTGGSLTVNGGAAYLTSGTTVSISTTNFAETQDATHSGLASNVLTVEDGTLSNNGCSSYLAPSTITGQSSYTVASGHCYRFTLTGTDNVGNAATTSSVVKVDTTAPGAPSLSFSGLTNAYAAGTTVYFKGGSTGGFTVTPTSTDGGSGIASYSYPSLTGFGGSGGAYTFDGSSTTQSGSVTATNNAGATGAGTTFTAQADSTAPAGGALTVNGGATYLTSGTSVAISTTNFAETQNATQSGIASNVLTVKVGALSHDGCSGYGSATDITGQSSYTVSSGDCFEFTLTGTDNVGNVATVVQTVKVDTSAPTAPSLSFGSFTRAYANGTTVYFKGGTTGGFTVTPTSTDGETDIASYTYPALTGFSHTGGAYTFDGSSTTQTGSVTATNHAGATGSGTSFTAQADTTAPTGGALTVNGGATYLTSGTSVAISTTNFAESQTATASGLAGNTLTVQSATLSGDSCQTYGSAADITGQSSYTVASGNCYLFTLTGTDNVGNAATLSATVKVDTTAPSAPSAISVGGLTNAYYPGSGTTVFFQGGATGGFTVTGSGATDGDTGIASYSYSSLTGFGGSGSYTFNASSTTQTGSVTATNGAGVTGSGLSFTAQADAAAPTGGALVVNGGSAWIGAGSTLTIDTRTDYSETQSATESGLASSTLTIEDGTLSSGSCINYLAPTTVSGTTSQTVQDGHCYRLTLTGTDHVGNTASIQREVKVDYTGPTAPTLSFSSLTNAFASGNTVYFKGATTGGFTVTPSSTDSNSGVASYSYPSFAGFSNTSGAYFFDASSTTQSGNVTATNNAGATSSPTTLTAQRDATAPAGGALVVNGGSGYLTSGTTLTIDTRTDFAETQSATESGLASSILTIASATLTGNSCNTYGSPTTITGSPSQTVASGNCYLLTLTGTDNVGNTATLVRVVKVDTSAPSAPSTLSFSGLTNAYASGTTVYFKNGSTGGFTVTGSGATDGDTGISGYTYPSLTGFGGSGGAYTFDGSSTTQTGSVTATNGAGTTGAGKSFTAQADGTAPSSSVTCNGSACPGGWTNSAPVDIAIAAADGGSGVASVTYTTDGSDPTSSGTATTVSGASASFQISSATTIRWFATDKVGNASTPQSLSIQIDTTAPSAPTSFTVSGTTHAFFDGDHTVFFQGGGTGGFTLTASGATDGESGIDHYNYPSLGGFGGSGGAYTFDGSSTTQTGSVTATNNATSTGPGKSFTAQSDSTAPSSSIACNSAACSAGWYTSSPVHIALSASDGGSGVKNITYTTDGSDPASSGTATTVTGTSATFDITALGTTTVKWIATDNVGNASSAGSQDVELDTSAPSAPTLSFSGLTNAYANGNTVYFKRSATGGFTVTPSSSDAQSGVASYAYPSLTGFSNTNGAYTFDASSTTQNGDVTATNNAGLTSAATTFTAQGDASAPTGGNVTVNGGATYLNSGSSVSISVTNFAEAQSATESGIASNVLTVQQGTLNGTSCTSYGSGTDISGQSTYSVSTDHCYFFTLTGTDHVGNAATATAEVKVDTSAPSAPSTLTFGGLTNAYYPGSGSTVYFRSGTAGGFTVTASGATDGQSGIQTYTYPSLSGYTGTGSYSFDASSTTQSGSVTATNGAGLTGAGTSFTAHADATAPTSSLDCNGSACPGGWTNSAPVDIAITAADGGSGVKNVTYTTDGSDPTSSGTATTVSGTSASFQISSATTIKWFSTDNVGNASSTQSVTVQIDTTAPTAPTTFSVGSTTHAFFDGDHTVFFQGGGTGGFTLTASGATDGESGVDHYNYPSLSGFGGSGGAYTFDGSSTTQTGSVTATNAATSTGPGKSFTAQSDSAAPSSSITCAGAACSAGWYTSSPVHIVISGDDGSGAGVKSVTYTSDGSDPTSSGTATTVTGTSAAFDITALGTTTVKWVATDKVGNVSTAGSQDVKLDTTAPSAPTAISVSAPSSAYWSSGTTVYFQSGAAAGFTLTASGATDAQSNVASYTYPALAGFTHTGGAYSTTGATSDASGDVLAVNGAGTSSASGLTVTAKADGTAPTSSVTCDSAACTAGWYTASPVSIAISAADTSSSGVAEIVYTTDGTTPTTGHGTVVTGASATFNVSTEGTTTVKWIAVDNVGNVSTVSSQAVELDSVAPSAPTTVGVTSPSNAYFAGGTTIWFRSGAAAGFTVAASGATDATSGVTSYSYPSLGGFTHTGGAYSTSGASADASGTVYSVDAAGNQSTSGLAISAKVDAAAPTSSLDCNGSACPGGWTNSAPVDIAITAADGGSGVKNVTYTTDGSDPTSSGTATTVSGTSASFQISSATTIKWFSTDNVGNASTTQSVTVQIDTTAPTAPTAFAVSNTTEASFDGDHTVYFQGGGTGGFTLTASGATDGESGVDHYNYPSLAGFTNTNGDYSFDASSTTQTGSVTATNAATSTGPGKSFTAQSDSSAPSSSITCNSAACSAGWYTSSPVHIALNASDGGAGVSEIVYTTDGSTPTTGHGTVVTGSSATFDITTLGTTTVKWIAVDKVANVSSVSSQAVELDTSAPSAPSLAFSGLTNAYAAGTTVYFKGGTSGGFTVTPTSSDAQSGVASYAYPSLTGFSNTNGAYTFDASSTTQNGDVTATNNAGLTSSATTFTARADSAGPTGGSVTVNGGAAYLNSGSSVSVSVTNYGETQTSTQSGIAGNTLTVEDGTLAGDLCSGYGAPTDITGSSTQAVQQGHCYRFTLTGTDHVGNTTSTQAVVKVDETAPTSLGLAFANAGGGAYYPGSGSTVYFDPSNAGHVDVTASATDSETNVSFGFPAVGGNWSPSGSGATRTYSYTAPAGASGTKTVTATNSAGGASTIDFQLTSDTSAPVTTAQCNGAACGSGWFTSAPVSVALNASDGGSGVQQTRYTVDGTTPTAISGTAYSGPISVSASTTLTFRSWDNVGNAEAPVTLTIQVDTTAPALPALSLSESSAAESVTGSTLYYNPSGSNSASFTVGSSPSDAESGIDKVTFPALTGMTGGGDVTGSPYNATYSWDNTATTEPGAATVTARNAAGLTTNQGFTVTKDVTAPSGTSITYTAGYNTSGSVAFTTSDGTDGGSGLDLSSAVVERATESLANGVCSGGWSSWTTVSGSPNTVPTNTCVQYRYRISDKVGNETIATRGIVKVDTSAPTTSITSKPADPSGSASPSFAFNANESSTFECNLDSGGWNTCSTGSLIGPLSEGTHIFQVRATDLAGNTGSAQSYTWFVDLTAPTVSVTAPSNGAHVSGTVTVTASASDNHGSPSVVLQADIAGTWTAIGSSWDTTSLADTSYALRAIATDAAGNSTTSSSVTVSVDNHAPSITFSTPGQYVNAAAPASVALTVTTSDTDITSVQFYECSNASATCAGGTWNAVGSPVTGSPWTTSWTVPASDGVKELKAVATDASSNTGTATTVTRIDRTAPSGTSITYTAGYNTSGSVAYTTGDGSDSGSGLDLSSAVVERATESLANGVCSGGWSSWTTVTGSPNSVPTNTCAQYRYRISDRAGNETNATGGIVKADATAPDTTIGTKPASPSNVADPTFSFTADESADHFECKIDTGAWNPCNSGVPLGFTLGEGSHTFQVRATDLAGNVDVTPASYTWTVDTVPPAASMSSPGAHIRGTVSLSSTSSDSPGTGIASVTFEYSSDGGSTWNAISGSSWDTTGKNGSYQLHVVATDNAGNVATSTALSLIVDNTAPSVTITNPLSNSGVAGSVALTASITDADASPTAVWSYKLSSGSTWTALPGATWNTLGLALPDGQYDVKVDVTDWAGNATTTTVTNITVDNQAPTASMTAPADSSYINAAASDPYTLTADANDNGTGVKQVDFYTCTDASCSTRTLVGTDATGSSGHYSTSWNVPGDGVKWIEAVATDNVGHTRNAIVSVTVDRTAPDTTIDTKPADPSNAANPAFTFHASESTQRYECQLDGGSWTTCASPYTLASTPADGSHTVQIRAVDLAGNTDGSPESWTWLEDTTKPTVTLTDPAAANAARAIHATVALASTASDPGANASGLNTTTYEYSVHGSGTWVPIATPAAWDTTAIDDGLYDVRVTVTDHAGNASVPSVVSNIKIDNTLPITTTDDPGQYLRGTIHLTGTSTDPKHVNDPTGSGVSGIDHVDFQISATGANSWTTIGSDTTGPFDTVSYDYDTLAASLADGYYDFRTVAYDVAGNTQAATTFAVNRLVDNTKPTVTLTDPGTNLHGTVTLNDTANDAAPASGVASTLFEISPAGANTWSTVGSSWNTTGVSDGLYDLRVSVTDRAGNVSSYSSVSSKRVDNTPPSTTASGVPAGYSATDVTVTLNPSDAGSGVSDTLYQVDGGAAQHGTSVLIPAPSNGSNDGTHTISFQSVDAAGNVETPHSVTVKIDATPPACASCSAADYMRGTVTLSATPSSLSGIHDVEFFFRTHPSGAWTSIGSDTTGASGTYSQSWNTTGVADGYYDLRYTVTSNSGATHDYELDSKVVDNTAPTVSVGAPVAGARVGGTVTISATSTDANALSYDFLVNGSTVASGAAASTSWDSTSVADGSVSIAVRATDPAGNSTTSAAVSVTVDNHAPSPTVNDPGAAVSGTPTLGAASDGDTATVEFDERKQGASAWVTIGTVGPPFNQAWNTTGLTDGTYELRTVATDLAGHVGTSPTRTVVVDNTLPTGALTVPTAGTTIGGTSSSIAATANDSGSGVASVAFQWYDGTTWHAIATVTSAPYQTTWNVQSAIPVSGPYLLRAIVTDAAGNAKTTTTVSVNVDSTAPTVTFANPGATLSGTVALSATTSGPDAVSTTFEYSVHGANAWHAIATDTSSPWSASFDTTGLGDNTYDLRASAVDNVGNVGTSAVRTAIVDNHLPTIASATPAEGSTVASASAIALDLSESATLSAITLDGNPTVAPTITGNHVDFPTGALATGTHVLALTLTDTAGKSADAQLHFTVYDASSGGTPPAVESDAPSTTPTTVTSADGTWSLTVPAGAMPSSTDPNNWIVVRLAPTTPTAVPPAPAGVTMQRVVEIVARWVDGSGELHSFSTPLDISFKNAAGLIPATAEMGGTWRMIPRVDGASLPAGQQDGYYRDGTTLHVLTHHLTLFGLVVDTSPPSPPHDFNATVNDGNLYLRWNPADAGGSPISGYTVYVDGVSTKSLGGSEYQYEVGPYDPNDNHEYAVVAVDDGGHTSAATQTLKIVPLLVGQQLDAAKAALVAKGFVPGDVTVVDSDEPAGTVVGPAQPVATEPGTTIALQVSAGPGAPSTKFVFDVVGTKRLVLTQRKFIGLHIAATRASTGTATLLSSKGKVLKAWQVKVRAGVSIIKLTLPKTAQKTGVYKLRWKAVAGTDIVTQTIVVQVGKTKKSIAKTLAPIDVLVAGAAVPAKLPLSDPGSRQMSADSENSTFSLAGDPRHNVQVIVIDADQYTLSMIHDLHTVFPSIKVVALSNDPRRLAAAVRAGASVGLPKSTPATKLAKVVGSLSTPPRSPASRRR